MRQEVHNVSKFWDFVLRIPIIRWIMMPVIRIYVWFIIAPTYWLIYRRSPWWVAGFEGRESSDICHQLTGHRMSSEFWNKTENIEECEEMIFKQFITFVSPVHYFVYLLYQ